MTKFFYRLKQGKIIQGNQINLLLSILLLTFYNGNFWLKYSATLNNSKWENIYFSIIFFVTLTILYSTILNLFSFKYFQKIILGLITLISSVLCHFQNEYNIAFDKIMFLNFIKTDLNEFLEILNGKFALSLMIRFVLPLYFIFKLEIKHSLSKEEIKSKFLTMAFSLFMALVLIFSFYKNYSTLYRNHKSLKHYLIPVNFFDASRVLFKKQQEPKRPIQAITRQINLNAKAWSSINKKTLVVLVIGETARADQFSLLGRARKTNPRLENENIVIFKNVKSCGTSTAVSIPCLFSHRGRKQFDLSHFQGEENLLDLLHESHFSVSWLDNNSGCQNVCDRITQVSLQDFKNDYSCPGKRCFDQVLLDGLDHLLHENEINGDKQFIVLHMIGSHGPSYFLRYPKKFDVFKKSCHQPELTNCSQEEIINAYDNTILYTDYILAEIIHRLNNLKETNAALIYVSDHGESLGEKNIYLHGMPYIIAPKEQIHVPMLMWFSDHFKNQFHLNEGCLKKLGEKEFFHDNIFHSILGLLQIQTDVYKENLDLFYPCKYPQ